MDIEERINEDLKMSGLVISDIRARALDVTEMASCGLTSDVSGYVIPYYNSQSVPLSFFRVKLFDQKIKYKQIKHTANHVYYPPNW